MSKVLERDLYEDDFFAWTQRQSRELRRFARTRPNLPLDLEHLAEEIADLGKEQQNALQSWTIRMIEHLLLLEHSPAEAPRRGWLREIMTFRDEIEDRLSPTLRRDLERQLPRLYAKARRRVVLDAYEGLPADWAQTSSPRILYDPHRYDPQARRTLPIHIGSGSTLPPAQEDAGEGPRGVEVVQLVPDTFSPHLFSRSRAIGS